MRSALRRAALAAQAPALLCACSQPAPGEAVAAITNGTIDTADPAVVALVSGSKIRCSGTLVAPNIVVTAAHCIANARPDEVLFGDSLAAGGTTIAVAEAIAHPAFQPQALQNDVGVVVLSRPAAVAPAVMWSGPFDASFVGQAIRLVGFGLTSPGDLDPRTKREGRTTIDTYTDVDFTFHPDPSQTCSGDSGGPAFMTIAGTEYLIGITSAGDPDCVQHGKDMRVDAFVQGFIQPHIDRARPGASELGQRCFDSLHCATGICFAPSDATHVPYCTIPCADAADCPASMTCADGSDDAAICRYPLPSPGALGTSCTASSDCDSYHCSSASDAVTEQTCTVPCRPNGTSCPSGFECTHTTGIDEYACFPAPAGGCSAAPGSGPRTSLMFGIALAIAGMRRRHRTARARGAGS